MKKNPFRIEKLEPRVMLSADPVIEEFFSNEVMAVEVASVWLR